MIIHDWQEVDALIIVGERTFYIERPAPTPLISPSEVMSFLMDECLTRKGQIFLGKLKADEHASLTCDSVHCRYLGDKWLLMFYEELDRRSYKRILEGGELFVRTLTITLQKAPVPVHMIFAIKEEVVN